MEAQRHSYWRRVGDLGGGVASLKSISNKDSKMEELLKSLLQEQFDRYADIVADKVMRKIEEAQKAPKAINRREGARRLGVSLPTFDALIKTGDIRSRKIGRRILIDEGEIENLMNSGIKLKYRRG